MITIVPATIDHSTLIAEIARQTFMESHAHSAALGDIDYYIQTKLTSGVLHQELADPAVLFCIAFSGTRPAGYSKMIPDCAHPEIRTGPVAKLERIYVLVEYHGLGVGAALFQHNLELAKAQLQVGMWLYTWTENHRALAFYRKQGFRITGHHDFPISPTHTNPNHLMWLDFGPENC